MSALCPFGALELGGYYGQGGVGEVIKLEPEALDLESASPQTRWDLTGLVPENLVQDRTRISPRTSAFELEPKSGPRGLQGPTEVTEALLMLLVWDPIHRRYWREIDAFRESLKQSEGKRAARDPKHGSSELEGPVWGLDI